VEVVEVALLELKVMVSITIQVKNLSLSSSPFRSSLTYLPLLISYHPSFLESLILFSAPTEAVKGSTFSINSFNPNTATFSTLGSTMNTGTMNMSTLGGQGLSRQPTLGGVKDGKSRAKSRDYLKQ